MTSPRVVLSPQAEELVDLAIRQIKGSKGQWVRVTRTEALDWLLKDFLYYGSPVVRSWARKVWGQKAGLDPTERR